MSKLLLRIDKHLASGGEAAPQAFARIHQLDPRTGINMSKGSPRQERVPISSEQSAARAVEVAPGFYQIEAFLPSGEILRDTVEVAAGASSEVVLHAESSPHEWLGWQQLMGNVQGSAWQWRSAYQKALKPRSAGITRAAPRKGTKLPAGAKMAKSGKAKSGTTRMSSPAPARPRVRMPVASYGVSSAPVPAPQIKFKQPVHWLSKPLPDLTNDKWTTLLERAPNPDEWIKELNCHEPTREVHPCRSDEKCAVFQLSRGPVSIPEVTTLGGNLPRDYLVVKRVKTVELVSLPIPWHVIGTGREAVVELIVQQLVRWQDFASSIVVRDEKLGLLLGFLSTGALPHAAQLAEDPEELLYGKLENALAAAAGGYALVGTEADNSQKPWHAWTRNLMDWRPDIPDGAIQWGTLKLRQGSSKSSEASAAFKEACRRGLPFYSLGMRWLLDGLERCAKRDPEAAALAESVRAMASRMHQQSPFTILRLGEI